MCERQLRAYDSLAHRSDQTLNNQPPSGVKSLKDARVGGKFAADDDEDVMDEDHYNDNEAQAGLARKAGLREMLAKA